MNTAPILIVEDDLEDREFIQEAWNELEFKNELIFFNSGTELIDHLTKEKTIPFLIISDVNLHKMDGFKLKEKLLEDESLNHKSVPFVFFSNIAANAQIKKSYDLGGHGFFVKGTNIKEIKNTLGRIVKYWQISQAPL